MTERHAAQAPALRERHPQIFNYQYSIVNSGLSGLSIGKLAALPQSTSGLASNITLSKPFEQILLQPIINNIEF